MKRLVACRVAAALASAAGLWWCSSLSARGAEESDRAEAEAAARRARSAQMTARIDELLALRQAAEGVTPAPPADDAELLRRASLDLTGLIPTVWEVRALVADDRPDKRARLIDDLLSRPTHANHLANVWRGFLLPGEADIERAGGVAGFEAWLREQFAANVRYDNLAADLLMARGNARLPGPALFYTALQLKPETLAANTSRVFLGVQIQCAQCHDHPLDRWTMQDFWGYAAFFARVEQPAGGNRLEVVEASLGEVTFPETDQVVPPKYLDSMQADPAADNNRRRQLAIWLVSRDNPFFARASVNRVWGLLFGRGLVEPVDDFSQRNPPSHPELLDELAAYFVETGFDLRELFRALASTQAYQRTSRSDQADLPPELFARMAVKSLTPDQLYDSLLVAGRRREEAALGRRGAAGFDRLFDAQRMAFVARFQAPGAAATEFQSGIPQSLTLMNGPLLAAATDPAQSRLLAAIDAPFFSEAQRVEALFLATLGRYPSEDERAELLAYVESGGASGDPAKARGDVLWALLNSAEFVLNH